MLRDVARRREEPKELDTGRVSLAMRARRTNGGRFPFVPARRRGMSVGLLVAIAVAGVALVALLLFWLLR
jgi:hypothetical protein